MQTVLLQEINRIYVLRFISLFLFIYHLIMQLYNNIHSLAIYDIYNFIIFYYLEGYYCHVFILYMYYSSCLCIFIV